MLITSFQKKMDSIFVKWGIERKVSRVSGRSRIQFAVHHDGNTKMLRSIHEVVIFLAKNKNIHLQPGQFNFKLDAIDDKGTENSIVSGEAWNEKPIEAVMGKQPKTVLENLPETVMENQPETVLENQLETVMENQLENSIDPVMEEKRTISDKVSLGDNLHYTRDQITNIKSQLQEAVMNQRFITAQKLKNQLDVLYRKLESHLSTNEVMEESDNSARETSTGDVQTGVVPIDDVPTCDVSRGDVPTGDVPTSDVLTSDIPTVETTTSDTTENETPVCGIKRKMDVLEEISANDQQNKKKRLKISSGFEEKISRITKQSSSIQDPGEEYRKVLGKLHELRLKNASKCSSLSSSTVADLQTLLTDVKIGDDPLNLMKEICKNEEMFLALESLLHTKCETEIEMSSIKDSKSVSMIFPIDQSTNFYCSVIEEAIVKMPNLLNLLINIVDCDQNKLTPSFAIKIANLICDILSAKDKRHSALSKLNTLHLMFQKSSVGNLKTFCQKGFSTGHTEGTRLVEELSELSESFKSSQYTLDLGMQITVDNVDAVMRGKLEHWILTYSRMDPMQTKHLSNVQPDFDIKSANHEIVYLIDKEIQYLRKCSKVVLAKKLFDMKIGFTNILKKVPYQPCHTYDEMLGHQEIFVECLEPLNEMEHQGMFDPNFVDPKQFLTHKNLHFFLNLKTGPPGGRRVLVHLPYKIWHPSHLFSYIVPYI